MDIIYKENFIDFMITSGVLTFGDFQTKSGRRSPYFINTGNYCSGKKMRVLGEYYARLIKEEIPQSILESGNLCLFGPAYKGIPLVVATSVALNEKYGIDLPYAFNRKEGKDHGEKGMLVGHHFNPGESILVIEDVITAGTALREVVPYLLQQGNVRIEGVVVSVDRMEKGNKGISAVEEIKEEYGISVLSMVTINDILERLKSEKGHKNSVINNESSAPNDETISKMEAYLNEYGTLR